MKTTDGAKGEDENRGKKQGASQSVEVTEDKPYIWNNLESSFKP